MVRQVLHTTIAPETHRYIERMQSERGLRKSQVIDWLVDQQKKRDRELEAMIINRCIWIVRMHELSNLVHVHTEPGQGFCL